MTNKDNSLWPDIFKDSDKTDTPQSVLLQQAAALGDSTGGALTASIETTQYFGGVTLDFVVESTSGFTVNLLSLKLEGPDYPVELRPVLVGTVSEAVSRVTCNSADELRTGLSKVFESDAVVEKLRLLFRSSPPTSQG